MNPFAQVYKALWECLESHPGFIRDVAEGNRLRFDANVLDPRKFNVQAADMPEVMLISSTSSANLFDTSSTSRVTRTYQWMLSTGDLRYYVDETVPLLATLEWYVFVAMHAWKEKLGTLEYNGLRFVKSSNLTAGASGIADNEKNRNLKGWSAVWSAEVLMVFSSAALKSELRCLEE